MRYTATIQSGIRSAVLLSMLVCLALLCSRGTTLAGETDVPQFLAGRQAPTTNPIHPPEHWSATENVAWKTDVPGLGWSSPIVWGNRVFLTTCINTGKSRAPRKGLYLEDVNANKYPPDKSEHAWKIFCIDLASGSILWEKLAHNGIPAKPHHIKNTLASETPATDGEREQHRRDRERAKHDGDDFREPSRRRFVLGQTLAEVRWLHEAEITSAERSRSG